MTIYKQENALNGEKKDLIDDVGVEIEIPEEKSLTTPECDVEYTVYNDPVVPIRRQARPVRRRLGLQLCLIVGMLVGLSVSILASLYLWRATRGRYQGRCGVGIIHMNSIKSNSSTPSSSAVTAQPLVERFNQEVKINGPTETLEIPQVDHFLPASITHDFTSNLTAIKDTRDELCFLLPLLRQHIPEPSMFQRSLESLPRGASLPPVHDEMFRYMVESQREAVSELEAGLCDGRTPHRAVPQAATVITTEMPTSRTERKYLMYAGGDVALSYSVQYFEQ